MKKLLLITLVLISFSCKNKTAQDNTSSSQVEIEDPEHIKIAKAAGLENWNNVSQINFTFNVDSGDKHFERSWTWKPKTNEVTLITGKDTISYNRKTLDSTTIKADQAFVNDKYWLLPQFEITQGKGLKVSIPKKETAPVSKKELNKITVTYGTEGGYTPGDAYDFFYDDNYMIREWIFRKGNMEKPSMITTFENYEEVKGIKIAKDHKKPEDKWNLYFTNISIKTE